MDRAVVDRPRQRPAVRPADAGAWACPGTRSCRCRARSSPRTSRRTNGRRWKKPWRPRITCGSSTRAATGEDSYLDCGIETVNGADVLLAVWDGDPARGKGGTAEVVQYALSIGKPVMIIDADTHEVRKENWHRLEPDDAVLADLNGLPEAASAWSTIPSRRPTPFSCSSRSATSTRPMAPRSSGG